MHYNKTVESTKLKQNAVSDIYILRVNWYSVVHADFDANT
jgi:hypothetical protein